MLTSNGYGTNISKNSFIGRNTIIANHEMIESDIRLSNFIWFKMLMMMILVFSLIHTSKSHDQLLSFSFLKHFERVGIN